MNQLTKMCIAISSSFHYSGSLQIGTLANSDDPCEIRNKAAFHQGLYFLLRLNNLNGTEIHHFMKILTPENAEWTIQYL